MMTTNAGFSTGSLGSHALYGDAASMRTFAEFMEAVRDSCESQAKRKNYTQSDIEGDNQLSQVANLLSFEPQHGIGEIVYKCAEYLKNPREVLLVKIAGWAYILWRRQH